MLFKITIGNDESWLLEASLIHPLPITEKLMPILLNVESSGGFLQTEWIALWQQLLPSSITINSKGELIPEDPCNLLSQYTPLLQFSKEIDLYATWWLAHLYGAKMDTSPIQQNLSANVQSACESVPLLWTKLTKYIKLV